MPKDDDDEGQEGSSIASQDVKDWEGDVVKEKAQQFNGLETFVDNAGQTDAKAIAVDQVSDYEEIKR